MISANLVEFKTRQNELYREAENYRLMKTVEENQDRFPKMIKALGTAFTRLFS